MKRNFTHTSAIITVFVVFWICRSIHLPISCYWVKEFRSCFIYLLKIKLKFKQWWPTIQPLPTERTNYNVSFTISDFLLWYLQIFFYLMDILSLSKNIYVIVLNVHKIFERWALKNLKTNDQCNLGDLRFDLIYCV